MGRNSLQSHQGKSLGQWQQDITDYCKDGPARRCKMTDSLETLRFKSEINFRCLLARSAVQYFYDELDPAHTKEIKDAKKVYDDCFRLTIQSHKTEANRIKKAFNILQRHRDEIRAEAKKNSKVTSKGGIELVNLGKQFKCDALTKLITKKTGLITEANLKAGLKVVVRLRKETAVFDAKKIKLRKK